MRISREKINKLAHAVADTLADMESVDFVEDRNRSGWRSAGSWKFSWRRKLRSMLPPGRKSKASAAPFWKARRNGTSSIASTTTRK